MKYPKLTALALAAAAALTLTACTSGATTEQDPHAALKSRDAEQRSSIRPAVLVPPNETGVDTAAFRVAMDAGVPFIYGITAGGGARAICETGLVVPAGSGSGVWYARDRAAAPIAGKSMSREPADIGGCSGAVVPGQVPDAGPGPDPVAQAAAAAAGVPFIYAVPDGDEPACHTAVRMPDGATWYLNREGAAPVVGAALESGMKTYGCSVDRPTVR